MEGTTMSIEATKDRAWLLDQNQGNARNAYTTFGDPDAAVLIVDAEDPLGSRLAKASLGEAEYRRLCAEYRAKRQTPTMIVPMRRDDAARLLGPTSPNAERNIRTRPPEGYFTAVVMSKGGNLFGMVPISPDEPPVPTVVVHGKSAPPPGFMDTPNRLTRFLPPDFTTPA
jgi:hypothetical protein